MKPPRRHLSKQDILTQAMQHALLLHGEGRLDAAEAIYLRTLAARPRHFEALHLLGVLRWQQGRTSEALDHIAAALKLKPTHVRALSNQGAILASLGRTTEALASYDKALAIKPDYAEALNNRGNALKSLKRTGEALESYERALTTKPDLAEVHLNVGLLLAEAGRLEEATAAARRADELSQQIASRDLRYSLAELLAQCSLNEAARKHLLFYLERDAEDRRGARMLLARLGFAPMPARAPDALLEALYARRAAAWDQGSENDAQPYRGATLVAEALKALVAGTAELDVLDAGCGTGLVGETIAGRDVHLDGVDLSPAMLVCANRKNIYRNLYQGDLVPFLSSHAESYDVIVSAATLIHFGDLGSVIEAAATALRDHGLFIFTVFRSDDADAVAVHPILGLAQGGCYAHGRNYVVRTAAKADFKVELIEEGVHEYHDGVPAAGVVFGLRRQARTKSPVVSC
jgi:predicted TPR repeat methyltransferase